MSATLLLIEDENAHRRLFEKNFARLGFTEYELHFANNGREGLDWLERYYKGQPLLIILDLNMPLMDGKEMLRAIRQNAQLADLPVIVLTASDEKDEMEVCRDLGIQDYLIKPINFQTLRGYIEKYL